MVNSQLCSSSPGARVGRLVALVAVSSSQLSSDRDDDSPLPVKKELRDRGPSSPDETAAPPLSDDLDVPPPGGGGAGIESILVKHRWVYLRQLYKSLTVSSIPAAAIS
jgi:hypothetical protein